MGWEECTASHGVTLWKCRKSLVPDSRFQAMGLPVLHVYYEDLAGSAANLEEMALPWSGSKIPPGFWSFIRFIWVKSGILTQTHLKMSGVGREEAFSATLYFESGKTNTHASVLFKLQVAKCFCHAKFGIPFSISVSHCSAVRAQFTHPFLFNPWVLGTSQKIITGFWPVCHETTSLDESCMPRFHKIIRSVQVSVSGVPLCRTGSKEFLATELQLSSSATFEGA